MPIRLRVEGLSAKRGEDLIFHDISFVLEAGEALIVTGPNGSGKIDFIARAGGTFDAGNPAASSWTIHPPTLAIRANFAIISATAMR